MVYLPVKFRRKSDYFPWRYSTRCRGGLGVAAASGEARSTQGLLEVWQSSQGLGRLGN